MRDSEHEMTRRAFIVSASASAVMFAHEGIAMSAPASSSAGPSRRVTPPRIESLRLRTSARLSELRAFYRDVLELPVVDEQPSQFTIAAGESRITFVPAASDVENPFYHFAFNIPENKIRSAREWQMARGPIMNTPPRLRDPEYPDEIRHFRRWNAHSVFFLDPAGNVLEYIARHTLDNAAAGAFTSRDVLCVSEIGFVVDEVAATAERIQELCRLEQYHSGSDQFRAAGDENGLLLVFKRGRELGTGSGRSRKGDVFPTEARIRSTDPVKHEFGDYPYELTATGVSPAGS